MILGLTKLAYRLRALAILNGSLRFALYSPYILFLYPIVSRCRRATTVYRHVNLAVGTNKVETF